MSIQMTNSIMNGTGSLKHNFNKEYREKEKGYSEENNLILISPTKENYLENVYKELFGKALEEYNNKQTRNDRKIKNYYEKISAGKQEKLFSELIIACGNCIDNADNEDLQIEMLKEINTKIINEFSNIKIFGSTIHLDEKGAPHLHLDYVPFCTNQKRGLSTRISMDGALREMGFKPEKPRLHETYIDKYGETREKSPTLFNAFRNSISDICKEVYQEHNVELIHLDKGKQIHLTCEQYMEEKAMETAVKKIITNPTPEVLSKVIERQIKDLGLPPTTIYQPVDTKYISAEESQKLGKKEAREELRIKIEEVKQLSTENKALFEQNKKMKEVLAFGKNSKSLAETTQEDLKDLRSENYVLKSELDKIKAKYNRLYDVFEFFVKKVQNLFFVVQNFLSAEQKENNKSTIEKIDKICDKEPETVINNVADEFEDFEQNERKRIEEQNKKDRYNDWDLDR